MVGRSTTCNVAEMVNSERSLHRCRSDGSGLLSVPQNVQRRLRLEASQNAGLEATLSRPRDAQIGRAEGMILRVRWAMRLLGGSSMGTADPGPLTFVGSNRCR